MEKSLFEQMGGTYRQEGDYIALNILGIIIFVSVIFKAYYAAICSVYEIQIIAVVTVTVSFLPIFATETKLKNLISVANRC